MVENTVVKEQLTNEMIEAGAQLTEKLDELGLPILISMWFFMPDINEWRLLFASPRLTTEGSKVVYETIVEAMKLIGDLAENLTLSMIGLLNPNHQLAQLFKAAIQTGPGVSRILFSKNVINGHFIDDALIYRNAA